MDHFERPASIRRRGAPVGVRTKTPHFKSDWERIHETASALGNWLRSKALCLDEGHGQRPGPSSQPRTARGFWRSRDHRAARRCPSGSPVRVGVEPANGAARRCPSGTPVRVGVEPANGAARRCPSGSPVRVGVEPANWDRPPVPPPFAASPQRPGDAPSLSGGRLAAAAGPRPARSPAREPAGLRPSLEPGFPGLHPTLPRSVSRRASVRSMVCPSPAFGGSASGEPQFRHSQSRDRGARRRFLETGRPLGAQPPQAPRHLVHPPSVEALNPPPPGPASPAGAIRRRERAI